MSLYSFPEKASSYKTIPILYFIAWGTGVISIHLALTVFTFVLLFGVLLLLRLKLVQDGKGRIGLSLSSIPRIAHCVLLNEYIILLASKNFILKKDSVFWEKVSS